MSDYNFLQNIEGGWKQLKNWCLHKRSDTPSDSIEGGVWYNETSKRIGVDIGEENKELAYVGEGAVDYIGVIDTVPPILTYNNNGTVTVASCNVRLYSNPDYNGIAKEYNVPSKTLTMTDGGDEIVIAHYNSGTPEYRLVNRVDINNYGNGDTAFIYRVWYAFGDFHSQSGDSLGLGLSNKVANRIANDKFYSRIGETGLELSESTGHIVNITAANVYAGGVKIQILPFTSSTDKFSIVYKNSSNVWQKQVATSYPNNLYNPDGQGLVTLPNNKFTAVYIYRTIGDDKECFAVIDNNFYNTVDVAVATSTKRTDIPNVVGSHCVLVGRIVYESGSASGKVQSVWLDPFTAGGIAQHNSLLDKDGGDTVLNYYGHVKQIHNTILENFGKASGAIVSDANNYIPIEQIPVGLLGGLTPKGAWNPATNTPTLSNPPLATTRGWFYIASTSGTALGTDWASTDWCISDGTVWQKIDNTDKVSSVFGRTGNVVAANGDYNLDQVNDGTTYKRITSTEKTNYNTAYTHSQTIGNAHSVNASQIPCAATGDVSATNVQAAIAELDNEKLSSTSAATEYLSKRTTNSQSISSELVTKKSIYNLRTSGTSGASGHFKICTITITNGYINRPLEFTIAQRARLSSAIVSLFFNGVQGTDPTINSFTYFGTSDHGIYAYKSATSTWEIYVTKVEKYDNLQVHGFNDPYGNFPNIVWHEATQVSAIPSGSIQATKRVLSNDTTGHAATATTLATARTISIIGDVTGSATFDGSTNASITATVADDSHNHVISNVDNLQTTIDTKLARDGSQTMTGDLFFSGVSDTAIRQICFNMAYSDYARIAVGGTAENAGFLEIATADDGTEPIYVRQYTGGFATVNRTATLLDGSGNTSFPGNVAAPAFSGNLSGNAATATKLQTGRTISLSGGVTGTSAAWDGSSNLSITTTVADDSHNHTIANVDGLQTALNTKQDAQATHVNRLAGDSNAIVKICDFSLAKAAYEGGVICIRVFQYDTWYSGGYIDVLFRYSVIGNASSGTWSFEFAGGSDALIPNVRMRYTEDSSAWYFAINCSSTNPRILSQLLMSQCSDGVKSVTMGYRNVADSGGVSPSPYGHAMASSETPAMNGTASAGTDNGKFAREGHVHPSDTSRLAIGSGLSSGANVVFRQYNFNNTYTNNVIYLEY